MMDHDDTEARSLATDDPSSKYDPSTMERVSSTLNSLGIDEEDSEIDEPLNGGYLMDLSRVHRCGPVACIGGRRRCICVGVALVAVIGAATGVGLFVERKKHQQERAAILANFIHPQNTILNDPARDICHHENPCGACRGDCDHDGHCEEGLVCFERDDFEPVPGCEGDGQEAKDYCYHIELAPDNQLKHVGDCNATGCPTEIFPLGECEGDCDNDDECAGLLECFERDDTEEVPGCYGLGVWGKDYCYDPNKCVKLGEECDESSVCCSGECLGDGVCVET